MIARKTKFSCGENPAVFEGYTRDNHWNGWECPFFTFTEACRVLRTLSNQGDEWGFKNNEFWITEPDDENEVPLGFIPTQVETPDGILELWCIGGWYWTWVEEKD